MFQYFGLIFEIYLINCLLGKVSFKYQGDCYGSLVSVASLLIDNKSTYKPDLLAVKFTFPEDEPVFPLRISEISSARKNEIEVYTVGNHWIFSDSYNTYAMDRNEVENPKKTVEIWFAIHTTTVENEEKFYVIEYKNIEIVISMSKL